MKPCKQCKKPCESTEYPRTCSPECKQQWTHEYVTKLVTKRCRRCDGEFEGERRKVSMQKYCGECSRIVTGEKQKAQILAKPKLSKKAQRHAYVCRKYKAAYLGAYGELKCEQCGESNPFIAWIFSVHHIYYTSRYPRNPNLHHPLNLILLCARCHDRFHRGDMQPQFDRLERDRGLKDLFKTDRTTALPPVFDYLAHLEKRIWNCN